MDMHAYLRKLGNGRPVSARERLAYLKLCTRDRLSRETRNSLARDIESAEAPAAEEAERAAAALEEANRLLGDGWLAEAARRNRDVRDGWLQGKGLHQLAQEHGLSWREVATIVAEAEPNI